MKAKLMDCSDYEFYGILEVVGVSAEEVQNKIQKIEEKFYEEGFEDWSIEDVFEQFSDEWEWDYTLACEFDEVAI